MKIHEMYPSTYLSAADLGGKDAKVTIETVKKERITSETGEQSDCFLLTFAKAKKAMVMNKTNAKLIASHYGDETADWTGKEITLYPTTCQAFGETVPCIRVRGKKGGLK